jgi:hypothetical protein
MSESEAAKVAIHHASCAELSSSTRTNATGHAGAQLNVTDVPTEIVALTEDVSSAQLATVGAVPSLEHDTAELASRMAPRIRWIRDIRVNVCLIFQRL